ncbi:N-acetylneuraminate synthase [Aeromonas veronii]|uniref:N-acetylneuraminate synthase n=1 Tax=Aeromonas veronii TaxID=654 RepID=UPI0013183A20|nr:N-acetylneuraminate synthase [Aeromonas veronii]ELC7282944.1 N-acetylneuraminate synthase [Aeromonas veronii]MCF5842948.1 N-acetylneuraminate synthase [Aeromonas veronii]NJI24812.1 N-acetylneuraminate synthase [Aeromonas veronii]NJI36185.1 N-acetylneuraminate synthase [Aeromonas veronii]QHB82189.1 N-acetylneuraminate synthase [Aeromonas veronii]
MTYIIAEAGVNHNGSEKLAIKLVESAYSSGANAVKFQTFKASKSITQKAVQADYQIQNTGKIESQLEMASRLELSYDAHHRIIARCNELGIDFLSTAFDNESLDFLVNGLGLKTLKIASGELTNAPFILKHAQTGCNIILSTGMASLGEVEMALGVIAYGYLNRNGTEPTQDDFIAAYISSEGKKILREKVYILHCTTEYPAPVEDVNLAAMDTILNSFKLPVGYSDHTKGIVIPIAAVARGARIIEKHFTLDRNMDGPDHKASLEPDELALMISSIRRVEQAIGDGIKGAQKSEIRNKSIARKSLVAATFIPAGTVFTAENLAVKRPGTGISPYAYWNIIGSRATKDYSPDDLI